MILQNLFSLLLVTISLRTRYGQCLSLFGIDLESLFGLKTILERLTTIEPMREQPQPPTNSYYFRWGNNFNQKVLNDLERTYKSRTYQLSNDEQKKEIIERFMNKLNGRGEASEDDRPHENGSASVGAMHQKMPTSVPVVIIASNDVKYNFSSDHVQNNVNLSQGGNQPLFKWFINSNGSETHYQKTVTNNQSVATELFQDTSNQTSEKPLEKSVTLNLTSPYIELPIHRVMRSINGIDTFKSPERANVVFKGPVFFKLRRSNQVSPNSYFQNRKGPIIKGIRVAGVWKHLRHPNYIPRRR